MNIDPGNGKHKLAWESLLFSEITKSNSIKIGPFGSQLKKELLTRSGYKVYGQENVYENNFEIGNRYISKQHFMDLKSCELLPGDFVISMMGTIGKCAIVPNNIEQGIIDSHLIRIRLNNEVIEPQFLLQMFSSKQILSQIKRLTVGGIMEGLSSSIIRKIMIPLPPLTEQKVIAQALNDVDELINSLDKLIAKKKNIKQATMQQLLTGARRLPGFQDEWVYTKLGDIAKIQRGASPRPIDLPRWYDTSSPVGWVRISDVTASNGILLERTKDYLSEEGIAKSRLVSKGGLIMSICATVGIPVITNIDVCIHDGFVSFSNLIYVDKLFLLYKLKELEANFKTLGQMGSQSNLNTNLVNGYKILLPTIEEQMKIAKCLRDLDIELETLYDQKKKFKLIKQGMMQKLLTGQIRLVDSVDKRSN